jgi:hypothetical protein
LFFFPTGGFLLNSRRQPPPPLRFSSRRLRATVHVQRITYPRRKLQIVLVSALKVVVHGNIWSNLLVLVARTRLIVRNFEIMVTLLNREPTFLQLGTDFIRGIIRML